MLKKHKRVISLLMAFVMAFLLCAPMAAQAKTAGISKSSTKEKQVLFSVKGNEVSAALIDDLKAYNINVTAQTIIEVVYTNEKQNETALTVKNVNGNEVEFNYLLAFDKTGTVKNVSLGNTTRALEIYGDEFDPLNNENVVIAWAVQYNIVRDGTLPRYQPKYAQSILYNNADASVYGAEVKYVCRGYECTLPNFTNITGSAGNYFEHIMQMSLDEENRYYTATNAYNYSNRVINTDDGGHYVYIIFKIGSKKYENEFDLPY